MKERPRLVWLTVLALGWIFDLLFWKQIPGINFAVFAALCIIAGLVLVRLEGVRLAPAALWLLPLIALFAVASFIRAEPMTVFLAVVLTLFLMALLAVTFVGGRWPMFSLADHALGLLGLGWSMISGPFAFGPPARAERSGVSPKRSSAWPIVRGLLIAFPILFLFASLLASADLVFRRELEEVMQFLSLERLPEYVFRLVYIALAAMALLGAYLHAATKSRNERLVGLERPIKLAFLGFTEASVVLGAVVILFAAFVVVQFKYFFGGEANIDLAGYTYAQYARRGYGELMAVAFFSLMLILALGAVTRRAVAKQQRWFSGLSVCIVGLVGVMLVSAFMRLILYESAYGFSRLRTYVHVSLAWLGFLLLAVVILELLHRPRLVALATLVASVGFAITLGVLNVDSFIVRQNVARALRGEELDIAHLASLSSDAIPPLASSFHDESVAPETRQALGAALACYIERTQPVSTDWRSFNLSRWYADRALASVKAELTGYEIGGEPWLPTITTPNGSLFECLPMYD